MDLQIKDKIVVITGGALGVGKAISAGLSKEGASVVIVDVDKDQGEKTADEINKSGGRVIFVKTDVTDSGSVNSMVKRTIEEFGRIDILVNNAGIVGQQGPWHLLEETNFDQVVAVNFKGVFLCSKEIIPYMIRQKKGKIIIISSCAAKTGEENNGVYSATKAAVRNMTQSLSAELGRFNINVNAVCPAAMDTGLMEKVYRERSKYFGIEPRELERQIKGSFKLPGSLTTNDAAKVVLFLASELSAKMTGQAINITSGIETH